MPRSPSRDLSDRFIGKRGYFRRPDALRRGRIALTVVAVLAAGAWAAVDVAKPAQRVQYSHSHGRLADVHAAFDNNCEACHKAHGISEFGPVSMFKARDRWHDLTCEKCHSGPPHHASANKDAVDFHNRCSNCHHDHNGRLNSLVRLADRDCNQCHRDLGKYHDPARSLTRANGEAPYAANVTNFVTDHPEFRSLDIAKSPRTLTFNHAVHMSPGQAYSAEGREAMTVDRLRELGGEAAVARYAPAGAAGGTKIQLDCASCHQLDSGAGSPGFNKLKETLAQGAPGRSLFPPRTEGAYFLPVNFEAHCRSCHPLKAAEGVSVVGDQKFPVPRFDVPHRKQPADLVADLKAGYLKGLSDGAHPALRRPPELGGKLDPSPGLAPRTLGQEVDRLAAEAESVLFGSAGSCAKCHTVSRVGGDKPRIAAVPDRTVWLKHAKFDHASHRGATCATCHPGTAAAYVSPADASRPEPVQILGLNTCRACHAPLDTIVKMPDGTELAGGGARHNCTDCHRYHNGDNPLQGRGAAARNTAAPLSLREWLQGSGKKVD